MLTLDVGCGTNPQGDVNLDLFPFNNLHIGSQRVPISLPIHKIKNFIHADAEHLPFRDNSFQVVYCQKVLEHVSHPYRVLKELIRVTKNKVIIISPHRFSRWGKMPNHRWGLNLTWFNSALQQLHVDFTLSLEHIPFKIAFLGCLWRPGHIKVTVNKVGKKTTI